MTSKTKFHWLWLLPQFLLPACIVDDPGPALEFLPGSGEPCQHYVQPDFFPEPAGQMPAYLDRELSLNPNNPNQMVGVRYYPDEGGDSVFIFDLSRRSQPQLVRVLGEQPYGLKWGAKDWVLFHGNGVQVMKINGDSLRTIVPINFPWLLPSGWNPQGDLLFCSDAQNTYIYDMRGTVMDTIHDFIAFDWYSTDSILGQEYSLDPTHRVLSLYLPRSKSIQYLMPYPSTENSSDQFDGYFPREAIQMHEDHDHFSVLAGNSLWVSSLKTKTSKEIMYFCFARSLYGIHYQPGYQRLLVEEFHGKQHLPDIAVTRENFLIAINPYTAMRLDTIWAFLP